MKAALVTEQLDMTSGGADRSIYELATCLTEMGVDVALVARRIALGRYGPGNFTTHRLVYRTAGRVDRLKVFDRALAEHTAERHYDIVHSMVPLMSADVYQPRAGSALHGARRHAASYGSRVLQACKIVTGRLNRSRSSLIAHERELCAAENGPIVAALSSYVAEQFRRDYGLDGRRLRTIRNGIAAEKFSSEQAREQGRKLRRLYDPHGKCTLLGFAAENLRLKGLARLLEAAELAKRSCPHGDNLRILIVSGQDYTKYWKRVQRRRLGGHVIFMGATQEMPAFVQMCDAIVLPTYHDACSRVVLEALAAGKSVITTRYNGAVDFLAEGRYGIVLDGCNDARALADAMLRLCDPAQVEQFRRAIAAGDVAEQVSVRRHARELLTLYEEIIAGN